MICFCPCDFTLVSLHWYWPPPVGLLPLLLSQEFVCSIFGLVIWLTPILHTFQFTTITATNKTKPLNRNPHWGMSDLDNQLHKLGSFLMAGQLSLPIQLQEIPLWRLPFFWYKLSNRLFFSSLQNPLFWVRTIPFLFLSCWQAIGQTFPAHKQNY